jgi:hypothetical protein
MLHFSWRAIFAFGIMIALAGCVTPYTPWPDEAGGGMAESYPAENEALTLLKQRYRLLLERRADERVPAQMLLAQTLIVRALREQAGGLSNDSGQTISAASAALDDIEKTLGGRRE